MNKKQLWDSLLQQAISGKLVPQLDSEPAVEQIGPAPASDDVPFKLPEKWQWVRMEDIVTVQPKVTCNYDEQLVSFIPMEKVSQDFNNDIDLSLSKPWHDVKNNYSRFADGDVIFAKITPCFQNRKSAIVNNTINGIGCGSTEFITLRCSNFIFNKYLLWFVKSPYFINLGQSKFRGTAGQQRFAPKDVKNCLVPLPPLEEQRRIVAKLDELKPLVDQFGEAYDKLSELEADFPRKLKASILQAAMQGKLVPQLDTEPAVEQIGPEPAKNDEPFALPEKWKWVNLKALSTHIQYGYTASASALGEAKLLRITDIQNGKVNWDSVPFCSISASDISKFSVIPDDIVIARSGGTVGKSFKVGQVKQHAVFASYLIRVRLNNKLPVNASYINFYLDSPLYWLSISQSAQGTAIKNVNAQQLSALLIPLPPLEEQRRIVERIEQLFAEVDKMSACKAP